MVLLPLVVVASTEVWNSKYRLYWMVQQASSQLAEGQVKSNTTLGPAVHMCMSTCLLCVCALSLLYVSFCIWCLWLAATPHNNPVFYHVYKGVPSHTDIQAQAILALCVCPCWNSYLLYRQAVGKYGHNVNLTLLNHQNIVNSLVINVLYKFMFYVKLESIVSCKSAECGQFCRLLQQIV